MRRVEFHDGEGIDPIDDNMVGQLAERAAYRSTRERIQVAVDDAGGADKPLLVRGADPSHSGTGTRTINLTDGVWCAAEDNPPAAVSDAPEVYFGDSTGTAYPLDANTNGSVYRRDILQARIDAETTTAPESRDFEDSATRALTTQVFDKRRVRTVTISVKKGTDQASEGAADANEPAPDAGYVKIFSFLIDNTGACAAAKRKRYTVGARRRKVILSPLDANVEQLGGVTWTKAAATGLTATGIAAGQTWLVTFPIRPLRVGERIVQALAYEAAASQAHLYEVIRVSRTGPTTVIASLSSVAAEVVVPAYDDGGLEDSSFYLRVGDTVGGTPDDVALRYIEVTVD